MGTVGKDCLLVQIVKVGLVRLGSKEVEIPNLKVGPKMAKVVATICRCHKFHQVVLWYQLLVLSHEVQGVLPESGDCLWQLLDSNDKPILLVVLL